MGEITLVTGGARSGKSGFAEELGKKIGGNLLYIATAIPFDEEMKLRVKKHQESRPKEWDTFEAYRNLGEEVILRGKNYSALLIDCMTIMVTNLLLDSIGIENENPNSKDFEKAENQIQAEIQSLMKAIDKIEGTVIIVTNELGMGIVPENKLAREYRDIAGRVNRRIADKADHVYFVVCGIPMKIK